MPHDIRLLAPAKVNLYLHVMGRRDDGYHLLDSLVCFTPDVADVLHVKEAAGFSLTMTGPFADLLQDQAQNNESNLIVKAARLAAHKADRALAGHIHLEKNIPMGAGLGGGSADAAMTLKAYERLWGVEFSISEKASLGADVPVCYEARPCRFQGIGDEISSVPSLPPLSILLIWPGVHTGTLDVFAARAGAFREKKTIMPDRLEDADALLSFLSAQGNDLATAAETLYPPIREARMFLESQTGCALARMSGSGSCVFGLYRDAQDCAQSLQMAKSLHPDWWVKDSQI